MSIRTRKDDKTLAVSAELEKGLKAKTSDNRRGLVSKIDFEKLWGGVVGAKVEVGQINAFEESMI